MNSLSEVCSTDGTHDQFTWPCRYELSYDGEKMACNGGFGATTATSAPVSAAGDKNRDKENEKTLCNHNGERMPARGTGSNERGHQNGDIFDHYKWALCRQPLPLKVMLAKGVPLPNEFVEVFLPVLITLLVVVSESGVNISAWHLATGFGGWACMGGNTMVSSWCLGTWEGIHSSESPISITKLGQP